MKPTEHECEVHFHTKTGPLAMLRPIVGAHGRGAPTTHRRAILIGLALATVSFLLYAPVSAFAGRPPVIAPSATVCESSSHTSIGLRTLVNPEGESTQWAFEYSSSETGPWAPVPGAHGTLTQAEYESDKYKQSYTVTSAFTGLSPEVTYYIRATASNSSGSAGGRPGPR